MSTKNRGEVLVCEAAANRVMGLLGRAIAARDTGRTDQAKELGQRASDLARVDQMLHKKAPKGVFGKDERHRRRHDLGSCFKEAGVKID